MTLSAIRNWVANDGLAITFQTMGQYRTALLRAIDKAAADQSPDAGVIPRSSDAERIAELERDVELFRNESNLRLHMVITCGIAATHPDPSLSRTGVYGKKWNSQQAEAVRALRADRDRLLAASFQQSQAGHDVLAERRRQVEAEGWTPKHDDEHDEGQLALAAAGYAQSASDQIQCVARELDDSTMDDDGCPSTTFPYGWQFKAAPPRRMLVKAGALILAEIERLDRAAIQCEGEVRA